MAQKRSKQTRRKSSRSKRRNSRRRHGGTYPASSYLLGQVAKVFQSCIRTSRGRQCEDYDSWGNPVEKDENGKWVYKETGFRNSPDGRKMYTTKGEWKSLNELIENAKKRT